MGVLSHGIAPRVIGAFVCLVALLWLALWFYIPAPPSSITLAAGLKGGAFEHFADSYREILARYHVRLNLRFSKDAPDYLRLVKDPRSRIDAAFVVAGQAIANQSSDFVSLGRINYAPIWIFYRGEKPILRLTQLRGKRVNVFGASLIHQILAAHGVTADNTTMSKFLGVPEATKALRSGEVDAVIFPPFDLNSPGIQSLVHDPTIRLMNVAQAEALTKLFPSLNRVVLPQGVIDLEKNIPASDVNLIASANAVVVRKNLHPELIYLLARTLQEVHGAAGVFQKAGEFPTQTDPEYPVAEEARDFYKNGPSFLHRYLPFWMINYAKRAAAIIVAAVAIVIPLLTFGPRLYEWLLRTQLIRLYRRLRAVNTRLKDSLTADGLAALQADLEEIDRAANILPMRHSDLFFSLLMHIDMTRTRRAARLDELPPERQVA